MPPGLRANPKRNFAVLMNHVKQACVTDGIKEVIFISSTSVYGKLSWKNNRTKRNAEPETNSGKQLLECEKLSVRIRSTFKTTILRMGGLIGAA